MKSKNLLIDEYLLCPLKSFISAALLQAVCIFTEHIWKTPFFILIATQRERHQSEKGERKNLPEAIYYKDTPKGALKNVSCGYAGRTNT